MKNYTNMPLLALRGNILFPHIRTQLDIVRPQSKQSAKYAYQNGGMIFLVSQTDAEKEKPFDLADFHKHGVVAEIFSLTEKGKTLTAGIKIITPARLTAVNMAGEFGLCDIETYECYINSQVEVDALFKKTTEYLAKYAEINKTLNTAVLDQVVADKFDVNSYVDIVSNEIVYRTKDRQQILAEPVVDKRLELLATFIVGEIELAKAEKRISNRVKKQVQDGQKEYYLREQMKAISKELGEDENEILDYREKIEKAGMPQEVASKANKEISRMSKMAPTSPDAGVIRTYVDWLCDLPWGKQSKDNADLVLARKILDEDHHGLEKIKDRIIEYIAVMQLTNKLNGPILCFVGPPGVGKTSIVRSIARALDRKYLRVSLGGVRDEAEIRGHRRTYIGAIPGKIIYMMKQA
ncbi:MAG: LON peptidase substrate-binding domain-containing protein, partial [Clostridia bacterium]|nr:LON peptidase substrate-binding domain-containing protein [Clostridia bacterium]